MDDERYWKYVLSEDVVNAAVRVMATAGALDALDADVKDAVELVCGTISNDEAEVVT